METLAKVAFLLTAILPGQLLAVTGDYEIKHGTYYSYVECLGDTPVNVSVLQSRVSRLLTETSLEAIWLPLQRRHLGGWYWLTGQFHAAKLSRKKEKFGRDCGVLRAADLLLDDTMCNRLYRKYLCQQQGDNCFAGRKDCLNHNGQTYWLYSGVDITWYESRTRCTQLGQQLSSLPKESREVVMKWLQASITSFYDVWVGLRRSDYFIPRQNLSTSVFYWRKAGTCPCESLHDCVIAKKKSPESFIWEPLNCDTTTSYICIANVKKRILYGDSSTNGISPTENGRKATVQPGFTRDVSNCSKGTNPITLRPGGHIDGLKIALIALLFLMVLIAIGILVFFRLSHRKLQKKISGQSIGNKVLSTTVPQVEAKPLDREEEQLLEASLGMKKEQEKEQNAEVEQMKPRMNELEKDIRNRYERLLSEERETCRKKVNKLNETISKLKHKLDEKKKLLSETENKQEENKEELRKLRSEVEKRETAIKLLNQQLGSDMKSNR